MAIEANLLDIYSGFLSAEAFNANNTLIEEALGKALNREGGVDNAMEADFDMGMYNIFNLKEAILNHQAVPLEQVKKIISASSSDITSNVEAEDRVIATPGQKEITLEVIEYIQETNSLMVFVDGEYQRPSFEYLETSPTTIEMVEPLLGGQVVDIFGSRFDGKAYLDLAMEAAKKITQQADSKIEEVEGFVQDAEQHANDAAQYANDAAQHVNTAEQFSLASGQYAAASEQSAVDAEDTLQEVLDLAGYKLDVNDQTGVTYTAQMSDSGDFIRMDNPGDNTVVIPQDSLVPFELGTIIMVRQVGHGVTTVLGGLGVTINAPYDNSTSVSGKDFGVALIKVDTNEWDLIKSFGGLGSGDIESVAQEIDARLDEIYKEILSASPTFVVNFDTLRNTLEYEINRIQDDFDSLVSQTNQAVASLTQSTNAAIDDIDTRTTQAVTDIDTRTAQAIDGITQDVTDIDTRLTQDVSDFTANITNSFSAIDTDFTVMTQRFDNIDSEFDTIQSDFTDIQNSFAGINSSFTTIQNEWSDVDQRMDTLQDSIDALNLGQGFDNQKSTTGYTDLPNGIILQWGTVTIPYDRARAVAFTKEFPNACFNVQVTQRQPKSSYTAVTETYSNLRSFNRAGLTLEMTRIGDGKGGRDSTAVVYWFAIGY